MPENSTSPLDVGLDNLRDIALAATGRDWRWSDHRVPDLIATFEVSDDYVSSRTVIEADHDGGCGCRRDCQLELNIEPQDREFIAATGPDVVMALIDRIRELEAKATA